MDDLPRDVCAEKNEYLLFCLIGADATFHEFICEMYVSRILIK